MCFCGTRKCVDLFMFFLEHGIADYLWITCVPPKLYVRVVLCNVLHDNDDIAVL